MGADNNWDALLSKLRSAKNRPEGVSRKEWGGVLKTLADLTKRRDADFNPERYKAETQASLAKIFIKWYFAILIIILVYVPIYNWLAGSAFGEHDGKDTLISVRDAFLMVSGAVTPLLAFVLGHYFKGKD